MRERVASDAANASFVNAHIAKHREPKSSVVEKVRASAYGLPSRKEKLDNTGDTDLAFDNLRCRTLHPARRRTGSRPRP